MKLTVEEAEQLAEEASDLARQEISVIEEYSGRGMYGRTTVAFSLENLSGALALAFVAGYRKGQADAEDEDDTEVEDAMDYRDFPTAIDSLGLGIVLY